jgi:hypothetical protein
MSTTTASKRLTRLRDLYFSESKPKDITPVDVALLTYLILRETEDHFITDSQETLGERLGCDRRTIARSLDRLEKLGWVTVEEKHDWNPKTHRKTRAQFAPSGLSVNLDRLPTTAERAGRNKPSEEAKDLAAQHTGILARLGGGTRYKRSPRLWERHQQHAAQRLIDELGADAAFEAVNFALGHPAHKKAVLTSLYALRKRAQQVREDMEAAEAEKSVPASAKA